MKKLSILMAGLAFSATTAHADEGMWTLYNLPQAVYEQMQAEGFTLPYSSLYTGDNGFRYYRHQNQRYQECCCKLLGLLLRRSSIARRTGVHQPPLRF